MRPVSPKIPLHQQILHATERAWRRLRYGDPVSEFATFCRKRWPARKGDAPILLIHQSAWYASILGYAFTANALADRMGLRLGSFHFSDEGTPPCGALYEAFGAPTMLSPQLGKKHAARAKALAGEIFRGLKTKRDVVDLTVEGLALGEIIYDSYLRYYVRSTVDLLDPRLEHTIERALLAYFESEEFFGTHEVAMAIVDHAVYLEAGVLTRVAVRRGIPIYHVTYNPVTLIPLDPRTFDSVPGNPPGRPAGTGTCKLPLPYHLFSSIFATLPEETRTTARTKAKAQLEARLAGAFDPGVLPGGSAFQPVESGSARVMKAGDRPRVLVMLHDYCDAPHGFRDLLFPDHYEWTCWLLKRASQTPWDWYVKPHPNIAHDPVRGKLNEEVLAELRLRFPKMTFLRPDVSNLRLISEGLSAMFTGYGTAGHEFAYLGVPVVNAGDNPHINYDFNFHPRSIEEFENLVDRAGELQLEINREAITEYAYMRFFHYYDRTLHPVRFIPAGYEESPATFSKIASSEVLRFAFTEPDQWQADLNAYLDQFFASERHVLPI